MKTPDFIYFDLGNVLVHFDVDRMYGQIAEVAGVDSAVVKQVVSGDHLQRDYELGRISPSRFHETFCRRTATSPDFDSLLWAVTDIFEPNASMLSIVAHLQNAGYHLGILSNTCPSHWEYCAKRFWTLERDGTFATHALSYQIKAVKPDPKIFQAAADLAGVEPQAILFIDDIPDHVTSARAVGFDAVRYTTTPQLVADLWARGIQFNY